MVPAAAITAILLTRPCVAQTPKHVLVVSVADTASPPPSIETANQVFAQLAVTSGDFTVDFARTDQDLAQKMTLSALNNYDGVIFQNTWGELPLPNRDGFMTWISSGKAFMAVHSAAAGYPFGPTMTSYPPYADMLGAQMPGHAGERQVNIRNRDPGHPATRHFNSTFLWYDEIYINQNVQWNAVHELLGMSQHPTTGLAGDYPLSWCRAYGAGRVFVTSLGHSVATWQRAAFQQHLLGGIRWMLKLDRGNLPRLVLEQPSFPGGSFAFHFDGAAVETYLVQASSNLADWICMSTNTAPSNTTYRTLDAGATALPRRFYRVFLP